MESSKSSIFLSKLFFRVLGAKNTYRWRYYHQRGHFPNLKNPKDLSERLIASLFSPESKRLAQYVDKVKVRDYIKSKGLEEILLKHYGVWNKPEDIDFDALPNKFILKANNGCGNHYICKDKSKLNKEEAIKTINYSILAGINSIEPHYRAIEPKVFCEELIDTGTEDWPTDYKFTCINGEICDVFVATDRRISTHYITLDLDWNTLPTTKKEYLPHHKPEKPKHLDKMVEIAKILSKDFKFVRVDLYEHNDHVYFSELTFYPWGALMYSYTDDALKMLGAKFNEK